MSQILQPGRSIFITILLYRIPVTNARFAFWFLNVWVCFLSSWPIRVHRIDSQKMEDSEEGGGDFSLPVFAVILTKFKAMPNMKQVWGFFGGFFSLHLCLCVYKCCLVHVCVI